MRKLLAIGVLAGAFALTKMPIYAAGTATLLNDQIVYEDARLEEADTGLPEGTIVVTLEEEDESTLIQIGDVKGYVPTDVLDIIEEDTLEEEDSLVDENEDESKEEKRPTFVWNGPKLNSFDGTVKGPSGKETYYNLPMGGVVSIMRRAGFGQNEYPYWVRKDGVKMLGDYIMVAANLSVHPRGSIVKTSLGEGLVCDTGDFASYDRYQLDIATSW